MVCVGDMEGRDGVASDGVMVWWFGCPADLLPDCMYEVCCASCIVPCASLYGVVVCFLDLVCCARGSSGCCECCGVCCACFSLRTQSVKTWVTVLWWSLCVWCVVCLYKLCVSAMCGSCVCARVWWWYAFGVVSGCLSVCVHVLFGCVVICSCAVWCCVCVCCCVPQQCVHHTAHEHNYKPHDSRFQNETDIRWIKGERTPSIFIHSTTLMWAVMITGRFALQIQVLFSKVCN